MRTIKLSKKLLIAALLLTGAASPAGTQSLPSYGGCYGLKARGYYGTPYNGGPQYGSGGGDQYGYGPAYSYARQAPNCLSPEPSGVGTRRSRTAHGK